MSGIRGLRGAAGLGACGMAIVGLTHASAANDLLVTSIHQITAPSESLGYSTPAIGQDASGPYIVYERYPVVNGVPGNGSIYYQRVTPDGAPTGAPVTVANSPGNQWLPAASGTYITYTLAPTIGVPGDIVLYSTATQTARYLTDSHNNWQADIHGDVVAWEERFPNSSQVVAYQISSGFPVQTSVMSGPIPPASQVSVGDRLIAWQQLVNGAYDVAAYDMQLGTSYLVPADPGFSDSNPATDGPWVVYEKADSTTSNIMAYNVDTAQLLTVADLGPRNYDPQISGNLIAYLSDISGESQIYLYRIAQGDTFWVADETGPTALERISGDLVTYLLSTPGASGGTLDSVYDARLTFKGVPEPATWVLMALGFAGLGFAGRRARRAANG